MLDFLKWCITPYDTKYMLEDEIKFFQNLRLRIDNLHGK